MDQPALPLDHQPPPQPPRRSPAFALAGDGWAVPDQALHPYPLEGWAEDIAAAVRLLELGATDREAFAAFNDSTRRRKGTDPAVARLELAVYILKLRRQKPRPVWPPDTVRI